MGRKPMIAGNWKMYKTPGEAAVLAQAIDDLLGEERGLADKVEAVVCPPFDRPEVGLDGHRVRQVGTSSSLRRTSTGRRRARSPVRCPSRMLVDAGCDYCIVGHSERREMFGETDETVNLKVKALLAAA